MFEDFEQFIKFLENEFESRSERNIYRRYAIKNQKKFMESPINYFKPKIEALARICKSQITKTTILELRYKEVAENKGFAETKEEREYYRNAKDINSKYQNLFTMLQELLYRLEMYNNYPYLNSKKSGIAKDKGKYKFRDMIESKEIHEDKKFFFISAYSYLDSNLEVTPSRLTSSLQNAYAEIIEKFIGIIESEGKFEKDRITDKAKKRFKKLFLTHSNSVYAYKSYLLEFDSQRFSKIDFENVKEKIGFSKVEIT